jgi:AcrR family transcriptional regulator
MAKAVKAPKTRRRTPSGEGSKATVDAIVEATARTLVKRGYGSTTTNHIAREAGVGIGSFYEYFDDKNSAVREVVNRFAKGAFAHASNTAQAARTMPPLEAVRHFIAEMVHFIAVDAELVRTLYQEVPFVLRMPQVQGLVGQLERLGLELADVKGTNAPLTKLQDRFYVLGVAVGAAIMQIATDPTTVARRHQLASELSLMIARYLRLGERQERGPR